MAARSRRSGRRRFDHPDIGFGIVAHRRGEPPRPPGDVAACRSMPEPESTIPASLTWRRVSRTPCQRRSKAWLLASATMSTPAHAGFPAMRGGAAVQVPPLSAWAQPLESKMTVLRLTIVALGPPRHGDRFEESGAADMRPGQGDQRVADKKQRDAPVTHDPVPRPVHRHLPCAGAARADPAAAAICVAGEACRARRMDGRRGRNSCNRSARRIRAAST